MEWIWWAVESWMWMLLTVFVLVVVMAVALDVIVAVVSVIGKVRRFLLEAIRRDDGDGE